MHNSSRILQELVLLWNYDISFLNINFFIIDLGYGFMVHSKCLRLIYTTSSVGNSCMVKTNFYGNKFNMGIFIVKFLGMSIIWGMNVSNSCDTHLPSYVVFKLKALRIMSCKHSNKVNFNNVSN